MKKIEILKTESQGLTVIVDDKFADYLCVDEALGCVAAALFGGMSRVPYVRTYEEWVGWQKRYDTNRFRTPIALIADQRGHA